MTTNLHRICRIDELPSGQHRIVQIGHRSIGVYHVGDRFYAIRNQCPHQFAPLCEGKVSGTTMPGKVGEFRYGMEGRVVRCPWHGWEFDVTTGRSLFNPHKCRVKSYQVFCETGDGERITRTIAADEEDPSVETYPVTIEDAWVVVAV